MRGCMSQSSQGSRFFVLKMMWLFEKLVLKRGSAVRRDTFIGLAPINYSKLRRSDMGNQQPFRAAPTELGGMGDTFCYRHIAPNGACNAPPRRPSFSTELDDVKDDFPERLGHGANDDPTARRSESRFQRWRFRIPRILGRRPRLEVNAAPLALNICLTLALLMLRRSSSPSSLKKSESRNPK